MLSIFELAGVYQKTRELRVLRLSTIVVDFLCRYPHFRVPEQIKRTIVDCLLLRSSL